MKQPEGRDRPDLLELLVRWDESEGLYRALIRAGSGTTAVWAEDPVAAMCKCVRAFTGSPHELRSPEFVS